MTAVASRLEPETEFADLNLEAIRRIPERIVFDTEGASLLDLGHGVLCLEFHSTGNSLGEDAFLAAERAYEIIPGNYRGLVIGNQGAHFSAGTDLQWFMQKADEFQNNRRQFYEGIKRMQRVITGMRTAPFPVVAAPFGLTQGAALEFVMFCDRVQTHEALSARFTAIGLGLLPALGGTSEMYIRSLDYFGTGHLQEALRFAFDAVVRGEQSLDADDACARLFLHETDRMTLNMTDLLLEAKARVLYLAEDYTPPQHRQGIQTLGAMGFRLLETAIEADVISGRLVGHDVEAALAVARVLTGGAEGLPVTLSHEELLDLEAQELTALVYHPKARERMQHLLATGKPLRN